MKKRTMVFALVLALGMMLLVGCGGDKDNTDYMSWTGTEWEAASDADKIEAVKAALIEIQPELDGQGDVLDQSAESMIPSMDAMFEASPDMTLKDMVEQTQAAVQQAQDQAQQNAAE